MQQGAQTTKYRDQAREAVLASVGGDPDLDCVLFAGSGSSAAIDKLQRVMGMTSSPIRPKLGKSVVVFVSVAEHHSNLLSWRQCGCHTEMVPIAADGLICTETLKDLLLKHASKKLKIGSFSAASNITGIKFQVQKPLLFVKRCLICMVTCQFRPYIYAAVCLPSCSGQENHSNASCARSFGILGLCCSR